MTRLLLDTHVWIWSITAPDKLSKRANSRIFKPNAAIYLSPISVWEAWLLIERGRLRIKESPKAWMARALPVMPVIEAPLTYDVAMEARQLSLHEDPADRFIAATAKVYDLALVTADERLLDSSEMETVW